MTKDTFGESLKREREMRGVTLEEISAATRIATRFLRAIENEQWDQLPGGVFNRGFVRAVARFLGLDEESTVAEYTLAVGDRPTVPVWTGSPPAVPPQQPWLAWTIATIVILALLAGAWFGTRLFLARRAAKQAGQSGAISAASSPTSGEPQDNSTGTVPEGSGMPSPDAQTASSAAPPTATDSAPAAGPSSAATDQFELKIVTEKRTKVTIVADQEVVYDGNMKAGENHFFSAMDHFQVTAKDAGVLHMELNGKALAPMGPPGHSGKVTLTRNDLRGASGGGN
jgi:cytoskeletal protein RodZ